jgi:hypothetical protein
MCVWRSQRPFGRQEGDSLLRRNACLAALEVRRVLARFNAALPESERLPTRLGMDAGMVGVTSDADCGLLNVVGLAADVAARLQHLGKQLQGRVPATRPVVEGLGDALLVRRLGHGFRLQGVSSGVEVFEIVASGTGSTEEQRSMCRRFETALKSYEAGNWTSASAEFDRLNREYPSDSPTRWYLDKSRRGPSGDVARPDMGAAAQSC